mgnify:CR=1 FL=1
MTDDKFFSVPVTLSSGGKTRFTIRSVREAAWFLYSDTHEYRLAGPDRLLPSVKRHLARASQRILAAAERDPELAAYLAEAKAEEEDHG